MQTPSTESAIRTASMVVLVAWSEVSEPIEAQLMQRPRERYQPSMHLPQRRSLCPVLHE